MAAKLETDDPMPLISAVSLVNQGRDKDIEPTETDYLLLNNKCNNFPKRLDETTEKSQNNEQSQPKDAENNEEEEDILKFRNLSFTEKLTFVKENITVEPMMFLVMFSIMMTSVATQNLYLEKACRVNLAYDDEVCEALASGDKTNYTVQELAIQRLTTGVIGWRSLVAHLIPALTILFSGSYSDRHGVRKPFMLVPIVGELGINIVFLTSSYFFYQIPLEATMMTEALCIALSGAEVTLFMAAFSYVAEVSPEKTRTLRIGMVSIFIQLAFPTGTAVSGILFKKLGFYGVFSLAAFLVICSFICGYTMVKEKEREKSDNPPNKKPFIKDFFDASNIKDTFAVTFKTGAHNRRVKIILILINLILIGGTSQGETMLTYLFVRLKFNWDEVTYSYYSTFFVLTNLVGTTISIGLLSHKLKFNDAVIGMISGMSKVLAAVVFSTASVSWLMYVGCVIDMMQGTSHIATRSIISKLVPSTEIGKVNSFFGVSEALIHPIFSPPYSALYQATMDSYPAAFWIPGGAVTVIAVMIFAWIYLDHRRETKLEKNPKADHEEQSPLKKKTTSKKVY